ncbi:pyridoxal phosphate-dependent class II aminotransferase [Jannaschia sp. GRR-S6-38]|uniref:Aminotransferase n=1 Tax=Jannaschia ovalis TaxID=3038773 RepID=A0ABY8LDP4_9RHOB|nr:pyridoxal phosphate-dependent class II aminotransferase [Jannaschia sp. GRR-S6-38]WGH79416.1 pyridoxal phosphate-dependent class II aminotransferase [Jannaschia sp. GRR-S6-38]
MSAGQDSARASATRDLKPAPAARDHGGGLDAARARWGGTDWIDLSTGINPDPYPRPDLPDRAWTALPDRDAEAALEHAARVFWRVPPAAAILAAPGASALIAKLPALAPGGRVAIPGPTYNEHAAAFRAHGFALAGTAEARVLVHPNNPDGRLWSAADLTPFTVVDESFCDVTPDASLVAEAARPGVIVLKSFGKFWGLAGLRLGFAIGHPETLAPLAEALGPWPVSGPALAIGAAALSDPDWAARTRARLRSDAARLDALMALHGRPVGGTDLFRLYDVGDARALQDRLARHAIWSRIFPYSDSWLRLGLPPARGWDRLEAALA